MARRVLVTGVARYLGARFAALLAADPAVDRVVGVDAVVSRHDLGSAEFVRADLRTPGIGRVLDDTRVDTVVHMSVVATPARAGGRAAMKETNVIGTMQLLAACQRAPRLRRLVVKSSAAVYGSSPRDPALFTEDMEPVGGQRRSGFAKDSVEVEGYVRGMARRRPDVAVILLRFANFLGPGIASPLTSYLSLPVWPTPLGYDARLQVVHESDGLEVLRRATVAEPPGAWSGPYNVAGEGVLLLSQAARRAGRPTVPLPRPLGGWLGESFRRAGVADFSPEQMGFLSYGRALDITRLRVEGGYQPRYTTAQAFDEFVQLRLPPVIPSSRTARAHA